MHHSWSSSKIGIFANLNSIQNILYYYPKLTFITYLVILAISVNVFCALILIIYAFRTSVIKLEMIDIKKKHRLYTTGPSQEQEDCINNKSDDALESPMKSEIEDNPD